MYACMYGYDVFRDSTSKGWIGMFTVVFSTMIIWMVGVGLAFFLFVLLF